MALTEDIRRPSKEEQRTAMQSYSTLVSLLKDVQSDYPEIEIEETSERIKIPIVALRLLAKILKATSEGNPISIVPMAAEMTTQSAAEVLGCSRPHLIKLLERGDIPFTKVGKHRRIRAEDVLAYKKRIKENQRQLLAEIMKADEESGLYDS